MIKTELATFIYNLEQNYSFMETKDVLGMILLFLEEQLQMPDKRADLVLDKKFKEIHRERNFYKQQLEESKAIIEDLLKKVV